MTKAYIKISLEMPGHPKILALKPEARWYFIELLCYCGTYLTDGEVSVARFAALPTRVRSALITAGLVEAKGNGWYVHDYLDYQTSATHVEARRTAGRIGGHARAEQANDSLADRQRSASEAVSDSSAIRQRIASESPADHQRIASESPREVRSKKLEVEEEEEQLLKEIGPRKRGTRLPKDWKRSEEDIAWQSSEKITDAQARRETEKFRDHFTAATGSNAVKLDWSAAWRNWLRRASDGGTIAPGPRTPNFTNPEAN